MSSGRRASGARDSGETCRFGYGARDTLSSVCGKYARHNVRMNNVMPGYCENVAMSDAALRSIPMGRTARFDEIGRACVFLASDASSYVTGQNLLVDGGVNRAVR
jgi:NAD(P)-dependent dehydrogenase (short-subunit alcohol dehydrogenase family)